MNKPLFKKLVLTIAALAAVVSLYVLYSYWYAGKNFKPVVPATAPGTAAYTASARWPEHQLQFIHAVNTPSRAAAKQDRYDGLEIDIMLLEQGPLLAAHDLQEKKKHILLRDVLSVVDNPSAKYYWMDLKGKLTQRHLDEFKQLAQELHIPLEHFLFEAAPGPDADLITQNQLALLLPLIDGLDRPGATAQQLAALQQQMNHLLEKYRPAAIAASFNKYPLLMHYFPAENKAVYATSIVRPSLIKLFWRKNIAPDKTTRLFLTDQYTLF